MRCKWSVFFPAFCLYLWIGSTIAVGEEKIEAYYSLPVRASLQSLATFELENPKWTVEGNRRMLEYRLPQDLVGGDNIVLGMFGEVDSNAPFFQMECLRSRGTAFCTKQGSSISCVIRFRNLGIDVSKVHRYLEEKYADDGNLAGRKEVAAIFAGVADSAVKGEERFSGNEPIGSLFVIKHGVEHRPIAQQP